MTRPTVLVATWRDGLFVLTAENRHHEIAGQPVRALASDADGGALAIVSNHSLRRRSADGEWVTIATSEHQLDCCVRVGDLIYVGTDDARVLRVSANGGIEELRGFESVNGRHAWYAGSAIVNGQRVGPPLAVRSITATSDRKVLLANVHVGGIPRSTDGGATWQPTIDIDTDVHEVCAHPTDPNVVIAAAGVGFCMSRDGGATWTVEEDSLHGSHCTAVAFVGNDVLVSAATDHFATQGAIYRRPIDAQQPFVPLGGGFPRWIDGIADTRCMATRGSGAVVADRGGNVYLSTDDGRSWTCRAAGLPLPSSVVIL